jgi:hypothetical protein
MTEFNDSLCRVMLDTHTRPDYPGERVSAWGLINDAMDSFTLLHSSSPQAWAECGTHVTGPIDLSGNEMSSVDIHAEPPEHVLVALAKFRLLGAIEAPKHLFE